MLLRSSIQVNTYDYSFVPSNLGMKLDLFKMSIGLRVKISAIILALGILTIKVAFIMTFYPDIFDEKASLQLMSFGNPLFEEMLKDLAPRPNCP